MTFLLACMVTASAAMPAQALQPVRHNLIRGDMPPGMAAQFYQVSDPALRGHVQPVQLVAPTNTNIEIGDAASNFGQARTCLLYTSPSPRDRTRSRMPSSA